MLELAAGGYSMIQDARTFSFCITSSQCCAGNSREGRLPMQRQFIMGKQRPRSESPIGSERILTVEGL